MSETVYRIAMTCLSCIIALIFLTMDQVFAQVIGGFMLCVTWLFVFIQAFARNSEKEIIDG